MLPRQLYPPFFPFPPFSSSCRQRNLDEIAHSSRVASQLTATATAACHRYFNQFCHSNWSRKRKTRWTVDSVGLWDCGTVCYSGVSSAHLGSSFFACRLTVSMEKKLPHSCLCFALSMPTAPYAQRAVHPSVCLCV